MRRKAICRLVFVSFLGVMLAGCMHLPGGIAASTTPIDGRPYVNLGRVKQTDSMFALFGIFAMGSPNTIRKAIDQALQSRGGDAMINVTVEYTTHYVVLFNRYMTIVEGDVIRFTGPAQ